MVQDTSKLALKGSAPIYGKYLDTNPFGSYLPIFIFLGSTSSLGAAVFVRGQFEARHTERQTCRALNCLVKEAPSQSAAAAAAKPVLPQSQSIEACGRRLQPGAHVCPLPGLKGQPWEYTDRPVTISFLETS